MKQLFLISVVALALSACAKTQVSPRPMSPIPTTYYQQITPVSLSGMVETIDTKRYSKMHIAQSSYLFK